MAGVQALVNQKAGGPQGNPNPVYYSLAAAEYGAGGNSSCNSSLGNGVSSSCIFHDVTQGDNDIGCMPFYLNTIPTFYNCYTDRPSVLTGVLSTSSLSYSIAYPATAGWDFATGIGTVNAYNLVFGWPTQTALALSITKTGTGSGTVTANSGTIIWNGRTGTASYSSGTSVTLTATANSGSTFIGWSGGGCSGTGPCSITIYAGSSVTATFNATGNTIQVESSGAYSTIQSGYNACGNGNTIEVMAGTYVENDDLSNSVTVTLIGGYDSSFSTSSSYSVITGPLIISNGTVTVRNIIIQ
jgi:hypothetical protein